MCGIWLVSDDRSRLGYQQPTETEWNKFRKYASWMREIFFSLSATVSDKVLRAISANLPSGIMCPLLQRLTWSSPGNRTFNRILVSSHLTTFSFWGTSAAIGVLADLASVMTELRTPFLQTLVVHVPVLKDPILTSLTVAISSAILRCGSSLTSVVVSVPLTDAAIQHIMQLPGLTTWETEGGPPVISDLSAVDTFPKLQDLCLRSTEALEWLSFFGGKTHCAPSGQVARVPRNRGPYQTLATIGCNRVAPSKIDAALMSSVLLFRGLVQLRLDLVCSEAHGCGFGLTDDDIGEMVHALPNLRALDLGDMCPADSCKTTVASLLIISTGCKNLVNLGIHFRTRNLLHDLESMTSNPRLRDLFRLPRCGLRRLEVWNAPLRMEQGHERVAEGFLRIFPSIHETLGRDEGWDIISRGLEELEYTNRRPANLPDGPAPKFAVRY